MKKIKQKGQVYSLISILITVPLLMFLIFYFSLSQTVPFGSIEKIIADQMHDVAKDIENDFDRAVKISTKRALIAAVSDVVSSGVPLTDSMETLTELVINGSIDGEENILMHNNTIGEWETRISDISIGFNTNLEYENFEISNYDGFNYLVEVDITINVSDKQGVARIDRYIQNDILVSTGDIEDPLFSLNTEGFVSRKITEYPYTYSTKKIVTGSSSSGDCSGNVTFNPSEPSPSGKILVTVDATGISGFSGVVSEGTEIPSVSCYVLGATDAINEINNTIIELDYNEILLDEITVSVWSLPIITALSNKYYFNFEDETGPDVLNRLENNKTQSRNAFETFVNIPELIMTGIPIKSDQSSIAYKYFSSQTINGETVRGLPSWFRISSSDAVKYGLEELIN